MAKIQHLYTGVGDPNDNPELVLTGDAVGNHLYSDLENSSTWIALSKADGGSVVHNRWARIERGDGPYFAVAAVMQVQHLIDIESGDDYGHGSFDIEAQAASELELYWAHNQQSGQHELYWKCVRAEEGEWLGPPSYDREIVIKIADDKFAGEYNGGTTSEYGRIDIDQNAYARLPQTGEVPIKLEFY